MRQFQSTSDLQEIVPHMRQVRHPDPAGETQMAYNAEAAFMAKDIFDAEKMVARKLS